MKNASSNISAENSIIQWMETLPGDLANDATGLWEIIPAGRDKFGLFGLDLEHFIRRAIIVLLAAGAIPVRHVSGSGYSWSIQPQYGTGAEVVAEAIINEWKQMSNDPLTLCAEGIWFARPIPGTKHVHLG
jgi:hypothetical protein